MKKGNFIAATLSFALGVFILAMSFSLPKSRDGVPGPAVFPIIIAVLIMLSSVALAIRSLQMDSGEKIDILSSGPKRVYLTILTLLAYLVVMQYVGFCVCTFILLTMLIRWYGEKNILKCILFSAAITALVYLVFDKLLNVSLNFGFLL